MNESTVTSHRQYTGQVPGSDLVGVLGLIPQKAPRILVVDDEKEIADLVELCLVHEFFEVVKFYEPRAALTCALDEPLDLALLDVMMPGIDGFELCKSIRQRRTYPIIMLTAKDDETNKVVGLTLGADDYITKPFRALELVARVRAQLRRAQDYNNGGETEGSPEAPAGKRLNALLFSGIVLDANKHLCRLNERELNLTPREFDLLWCLGTRRGDVVSPQEIFEAVWQEEYLPTSANTIMVHIRHLREKLDEAGGNGCIKTVWGVGYKIDAQ
ncbi:MAG: response regulator transcription factor [Coriobacteriales bacterium]|jgi:two-component system response regulator VanR|nr:response regulator transcription factor [Coriobacteriales bacterium]